MMPTVASMLSEDGWSSYVPSALGSWYTLARGNDTSGRCVQRMQVPGALIGLSPGCTRCEKYEHPRACLHSARQLGAVMFPQSPMLPSEHRARFDSPHWEPVATFLYPLSTGVAADDLAAARLRVAALKFSWRLSQPSRAGSLSQPTALYLSVAAATAFSAAPIAVSVIGVQGGVVFAIPAVNRSWLPVKQMLQPSALPPDLRPGGHVSVRGFARQHKGREAAALSAGSLHDAKVVLAPNRKKLPV